LASKVIQREVSSAAQANYAFGSNTHAEKRATQGVARLRPRMGKASDMRTP